MSTTDMALVGGGLYVRVDEEQTLQLSWYKANHLQAELRQIIEEQGYQLIDLPLRPHVDGPIPFTLVSEPAGEEADVRDS